MKKNYDIEYWAHMLDEAFSGEDEGHILPKSKDEKFKMSDVFTYDGGMIESDIREVFDKVWYDWDKYVEAECHEELEYEHATSKIDDYDVWSITLNELWGNKRCCSMIIDWLGGEYDGEAPFKEDDVTSVKELVDAGVKYLYDKFNDNEDFEFKDIEDRGHIKYAADPIRRSRYYRHDPE